MSERAAEESLTIPTYPELTEGCNFRSSTRSASGNGRRSVELDGRRHVVSGAAGLIGSRLVNQLMRTKAPEIEYPASGQTLAANHIGSTEEARRDRGLIWLVDVEEFVRRLIDWRRSDKGDVKGRRRAFVGGPPG